MKRPKVPFWAILENLSKTQKKVFGTNRRKGKINILGGIPSSPSCRSGPPPLAGVGWPGCPSLGQNTGSGGGGEGWLKTPTLTLFRTLGRTPHPPERGWRGGVDPHPSTTHLPCGVNHTLKLDKTRPGWYASRPWCSNRAARWHHGAAGRAPRFSSWTGNRALTHKRGGRHLEGAAKASAIPQTWHRQMCFDTPPKGNPPTPSTTIVADWPHRVPTSRELLSQMTSKAVDPNKPQQPQHAGG